jgi:hypothetical protein
MKKYLDRNICVYLHVNPIAQEIFYVGIGSIKRPLVETGRNKYWDEYVKSCEYDVVIIYTKLSWNKAALLEKQFIKQIGRKDKGLGTLLNRTDGGEGRQGRSVWSEEDLITEALKYKTRGEFDIKSNGAYKAAYRHGILDEICSHMFTAPGRNKFKLTKENCRTIALCYDKKADLFKAKKSIYNKIIRMKWADELFAHMLQQINKDDCARIALEYTTRTNLMIGYKYIYNLIIRNKWGQELFNHMA